MRILGWKPFSLRISKAFSHCILSFNFVFEKSSVLLILNLLWHVSFFSSLDRSSIFSLATVFWKFTMICWMNGHFQAENLWLSMLEFFSMSIFYLIISFLLLLLFHFLFLEMLLFRFWTFCTDPFIYLYFILPFPSLLFVCFVLQSVWRNNPEITLSSISLDKFFIYLICI